MSNTKFTKQNLLDGFTAMNIDSGSKRFERGVAAHAKALNDDGASQRDAVKIGIETAFAKPRPFSDRSILDDGLKAAGLMTITRRARNGARTATTQTVAAAKSMPSRVSNGLKNSIADVMFPAAILTLSLAIGFWIFTGLSDDLVQTATLAAGSTYGSFKAAMALLGILLFAFFIGCSLVLTMRFFTGYPYEEKKRERKEELERRRAEREASQPVPTT